MKSVEELPPNGLVSVHPWGFSKKTNEGYYIHMYVFTITIFHFNKQKIIIHKMVKICHNICMIE